MNYTHYAGRMPYCADTASCNCSCDTGYSATDPRATEPTAQSLSAGNINTNVVSNGAIIPLAAVYNTSGNHISGMNPFTLKAGHKYLVEYTVIGFAAAAANSFGAKLQLNGVDVAGSAVAVSSLTTALAASGGAIVTVPAGSAGLLSFVSVSTTTATYNYSSIRIVEVE